MSFRRQVAPLVRLEGEALDRAMAGIGMSFAVKAEPYSAIEDVLFFASQLGMEKNDFRVLNVVCKWIDVHAARINVDRLTRLVQACAEHERTRAFWAAVGQWQHRDPRFGRLGACDLGARGSICFRDGVSDRAARGASVVCWNVFAGCGGDAARSGE